jgi:hypothetical protein
MGEHQWLTSVVVDAAARIDVPSTNCARNATDMPTRTTKDPHWVKEYLLLKPNLHKFKDLFLIFAQSLGLFTIQFIYLGPSPPF